MDKYELQKLRDLPIEGVAERLGLRVERHKCLCPFHDDHHASLSFRNNRYKCFACGESGDTISLAEKMLGKGFVEACRWLSPLPAPPLGECHRAVESSPITGIYSQRRGSENEALPQRGSGEGADVAARYARFFERPFLSPEARRFLFEERKLDERVVRWCRLTSWRDKQGIPWLQIPYYNKEGKLVGVQNRNLSPLPALPSVACAPQSLCSQQAIAPLGECHNLAGRGSLSGSEALPQRGSGEGAAPRFRFPAGSECSIYNLPVLNRLKPGDALYIAEGCSDCWSLLSAGHKAIAIPSATLLKRKDKEQLSIINSQLSIDFAMYPDNDVPGERLFLQLKEVLPNLVHYQLPVGCKDYSEFYLQQNTKTQRH